MPSGKVDDDLVIPLDPTAVAAVGGTLPANVQLDGANLLPAYTAYPSLFEWAFGPRNFMKKWIGHGYTRTALAAVKSDSDPCASVAHSITAGNKKN